MMETHRVKITDQLHIYRMAMNAGLLEAAELLDALPNGLKGTPGVALSLATISAKAHEDRALVISQNLMAIAKAGLPVERYKSISFDPKTSELICEFYDPDLFDSSAA